MAKSACGASNACSLCALHQRLANYSPRAFQQKTGRCLCSPMRRLSEYTYPRAPGSMHMPARGRTRHLHASARRAGAWRYATGSGMLVRPSRCSEAQCGPARQAWRTLGYSRQHSSLWNSTAWSSAVAHCGPNGNETIMHCAVQRRRVVPHPTARGFVNSKLRQILAALGTPSLPTSWYHLVSPCKHANGSNDPAHQGAMARRNLRREGKLGYF